MALAAPDKVQRIIRRDAIQPGRETGPCLVFLQLSISPQKGFLHHVLGVLFVSCHAKCETENGAAVLLNQQSKGVAVTRPRPLNLAAGFHFHPAFRLRLSVTVRQASEDKLSPVNPDAARHRVPRRLCLLPHSPGSIRARTPAGPIHEKLEAISTTFSVFPVNL